MLKGTTGRESGVFIIEVSTLPTVARNRTQTLWQPQRPNGKRFVNIGPKFPFTVDEDGVVRRARYLPGTKAQYLWGRYAP